MAHPNNHVVVVEDRYSDASNPPSSSFFLTFFIPAPLLARCIFHSCRILPPFLLLLFSSPQFQAISQSSQQSVALLSPSPSSFLPCSHPGNTNGPPHRDPRLEDCPPWQFSFIQHGIGEDKTSLDVFVYRLTLSLSLLLSRSLVSRPSASSAPRPPTPMETTSSSLSGSGGSTTPWRCWTRAAWSH